MGYKNRGLYWDDPDLAGELERRGISLERPYLMRQLLRGLMVNAQKPRRLSLVARKRDRAGIKTIVQTNISKSALSVVLRFCIARLALDLPTMSPEAS